MNILQMPNLLEFNINHGFVTDLNVSFSVGDDPEKVAQNRLKIKQKIGIDTMVINKQAHTNKIVEITLQNKDLLDENNPDYIADGLFTKLPNIAITAYSADCAIIFIYAPDINAIAIVHSGWQGTFTGINENMLQKFISEEADLSKLVVAISPSISVNNYEVQGDFYQKFVQQDPFAESFFINKNHYDNAGYIASKYKKFGIKNIYVSNQDTYSDPDLFSHRYFTHCGKKNGRMLGFIYLNNK